MTHCDNVLDLSKHPRWLVLHQQERCRQGRDKSIDGLPEDLRLSAAIAGCLRPEVDRRGGYKPAARSWGVDYRSLQGWCAGTGTLPRAEHLLRVARLHPPLADLLAREMGLRVDGLTAQELAALRALLPAARVVERLVEPDQADLFAG
jgi:hypothetical protein